MLHSLVSRSRSPGFLAVCRSAVPRTGVLGVYNQQNRFYTSKKTDDSDEDNGSDSIKSPSREMKLRVYTRTGDKGRSSLYTGERRAKTDEIFEALGTIDELSSAIGLAHQFCTESKNDLPPALEKIQCVLQDIGSNVATPKSSATAKRLEKVAFPSEHVSDLEGAIDALDDDLPALENFILPSGGRASSALHVARSICRRAERRVVPLTEKGETDAMCQKYLNRLSDYLFTAARHASQHDGQQEIIYRRPEHSASASSSSS
eukprot:Clim_evm1s215 gene=Clim_evmTU1s215